MEGVPLGSDASASLHPFALFSFIFGEELVHISHGFQEFQLAPRLEGPSSMVKTKEQMAIVNALDFAVPKRVLKDKDWSACERIGDESTTEAEIASHNNIYMLNQDQEELLDSRRIAMLQKDTGKAQPTATDAHVAQECKSFSSACYGKE